MTLAAGPGEADVWILRRPWTGGPEHELDDRERKRAGAFVHPRDRARYVSAHVALRRILARYLGVGPADVRFGRAPCPRCAAPHGRPVVLDGSPGNVPPPHFSLSHGHGVALVAVASVPVGVDVQRVPSAATVEVCSPRLHVRERADLAGVPPERRPAAFARLWTRKEAYLKGLGTGLGRGPAADYLGDGDAAARPDGWLVDDLPADPGYAAALALRGSDVHRVSLRGLPEGWTRHADPAAVARREGDVMIVDDGFPNGVAEPI
ncbi:hypothetical protein GCM10022254_15930 [Actinomadura meridiana]|uniref:4'-phosphopantetheinyl transferase domain-containing protein n=1 Tax=Actinomadura meridiana TaxID=559626 RepID=A0ABP8BVN3_9ACTN